MVKNQWWELPENGAWRKFISRMFYAGYSILIAWAALFFFAFYVFVADYSVDNDTNWTSIYRTWLVSSIIFIIVFCFYMFILGVSVYRESRARVVVSTVRILFDVIVSVMFWWFVIVIFFYRKDYEPIFAVVLFDLIMMAGLMLTLWGMLFILITFISRAPNIHRSESDV